VLHWDIEPSNILIRPDGTPVLIDFGSARRVSGDQDLSKYVQLTPAFAPPEQHYGQYGKWTDIYNFAATLFYALTGRKPDPAAAARPRLTDELQGQYEDGSLRGIDEALALNYRERPQSVAEWRLSLGLGPDIGARPIRLRRDVKPQAMTRRQPSSWRNRGDWHGQRGRRIRPRLSCLAPRTWKPQAGHLS